MDVTLRDIVNGHGGDGLILELDDLRVISNLYNSIFLLYEMTAPTVPSTSLFTKQGSCSNGDTQRVSEGISEAKQKGCTGPTSGYNWAEVSFQSSLKGYAGSC